MRFEYLVANTYMDWDRMLDALMETTCPLCILCWTIEVDVDGLSFSIPSFLFQNLGINSCGYCYHWCLQKYLIALNVT